MLRVRWPSAFVFLYLDQKVDELTRMISVCRFGAVIEEFEVQDALNAVLAEKDAVPALSDAMASKQISLMA